MNILAITRRFPPDAADTAAILSQRAAEALLDRGHDVLVLTARPSRWVKDPPHVDRRLQFVDERSPHALGNDPIVYATREAQARGFDSYNVHILTEQIQAFAPDVVLLHDLSGLGTFGILAALRLLGVPWVWHGNASDLEDLLGSLAGHPSSFKLLAGPMGEGELLVSTRRDKLALARIEPLATNEVTLIPPWVESDRPVLRTGTDPSHLRIVAHAANGNSPGMRRLVDAALWLREAGVNDLSIDVFGPAASPFVHAEGLHDRLLLRGPARDTEPFTHFDAYDLAIFPQHPAPELDLWVLEAASRGCVPVLTARAGASEWLVHGVHCVKFEPTGSGLGSVLAAIRRGEVSLRGLALRAQHAVNNDFHADVIVPRIEQALERGIRRAPELRLDRAAETYRMARMAEHIQRALVEDALAAKLRTRRTPA